ncbi:MAG TPA: bifunctional riboflavin kinase/FAD synthetase [Streptosporangiaceae bacterium]|nr:bifunctional riboflavin kinase/FAD synthetase [Streptosporangiaceae bacterium]
MQRWYGLDEVPSGWGPSVVTIGVFDGVHCGHQRIVTTAVEMAARLGLPLVVMTFDPHPAEVVRPGSRPLMLCTLDRRVRLLSELGPDVVCVVPFTLELSRLEPEDFIRAALVDRLHTRAVVVGDNFRFGHRATGDLALLAEFGEKYDFCVEGVPLLAADEGGAVSSSAVRALIATGDVAAAARDLGRPHRVEGVVVPGHRRGRALGFPTANLRPMPHAAIPADGVYAGWLAVLDRQGAQTHRWPAAISVGTNPTFGDEDRMVEAYVLDRDDLELYGARVAVDFAARLRGMTRFDSVEELATQMRLDVTQARSLVGDPEPDS